MPYLIEREVVCPHCQLPNQAELWSIINVQMDPELKDLLLGGEINMVECSSCQVIFYAEHFLIYHDPGNELMAFVYPLDQASEKEKWMEKTKQDFEESQALSRDDEKLSYKPLAVFGLDDLVERVKWEEEVNIQAEIVSVMSGQGAFPVHKLKRAAARQLQLPPVLPYLNLKDHKLRESVLEALGKLEQINENLFVYRQAKEWLTEHPEIPLEKVLG